MALLEIRWMNRFAINLYVQIVLGYLIDLLLTNSLSITTPSKNHYKFKYYRLITSVHTLF